jgi:hypothetical protein
MNIPKPDPSAISLRAEARPPLIGSFASATPPIESSFDHFIQWLYIRGDVYFEFYPLPSSHHSYPMIPYRSCDYDLVTRPYVLRDQPSLSNISLLKNFEVMI